MPTRQIVVLSKNNIHQIIRIVERRLLPDEPYQIAGYSDSDSALEKSGPGNCPDLVIVQIDRLAPDNDELEYVRRIRGHNNHIPFIFLISEDATTLRGFITELGFLGLTTSLSMDGQINQYRKTRDDNKHPYLHAIVTRYSNTIAAGDEGLAEALRYVFEGWRKETTLYSGDPIS